MPAGGMLSTGSCTGGIRQQVAAQAESCPEDFSVPSAWYGKLFSLVGYAETPVTAATPRLNPLSPALICATSIIFRQHQHHLKSTAGHIDVPLLLP